MKVKNNISSQCRQLRLPAIGEQVQQMADQASATGISYLEFAENLLAVEIKYRNNKDQERKIKAARLPRTYDLLGYDCSLVDGMPSARLEQLKELTWLDQNFNLVIMGPNGIGKSFLAAGLCHHAIESGYRAYFRPMEQIMSMLKNKDQLKSAMVDYRRLLKAQLIVIDDIMTITMERNDANSFFHFINAMHERTSFGITTNKSPKEWVETIGDEVITTAILDRLLYHCEIIKLTGESFRLKNRKTIFEKAN
ncbi:MAG TPA: ATP-binding protein [Sphingobacteriaceae bacterium]|nr:ATP-binding protein [Sphingobacteriaceae bacterium]